MRKRIIYISCCKTDERNRTGLGLGIWKLRMGVKRGRYALSREEKNDMHILLKCMEIQK